MALKPMTLIVKCVGTSCNIRCDYCFYHDKNQGVKEIMSDRVLEKLIKDALNLNQKVCTFIWHGGEPLLAGLDFFERVVVYQKKYNLGSNLIDNRIQTNGLLITDEWLDLFVRNNFIVGVSIDGPGIVHDRYRKDVNGKGTFDRVIKNIRKAQAAGLDIGAIAVVTSFSVNFPNEIYRFFISNGLKKLSFNPAFEINCDGEIIDFSVSPDDYSRFLLRIVDLWTQDDDPEIKIRQIHEPLRGLLFGRPTVCTYCGGCAQSIDILPNGDVTPCHESIDDQIFVLGNLVNHSLREILSSSFYETYEKYAREVPRSCRTCRWFAICHGGCSHHRRLTTTCGYLEKYIYCDSRRKVFEVLERKIKKFRQLSG